MHHTDDTTVTELGFASTVSGSGASLAGQVTFEGLTLDSPEDVDFYSFRLDQDAVAGARLDLFSISTNDQIIDCHQ